MAPLPEGIFSLLDTDLYKLTMQCAILKYMPDIRMLGLVKIEGFQLIQCRSHLCIHESHS